jgi:hypothetical protein
MNELEIFCSDISELQECESVNRGYRSDIFVKTGNDFFRLHVYDITRLKQDFNSEISIYGYFGIEPNIILVSKVNLQYITKTIESLYKQKYFEQIKPLPKEELARCHLNRI